MSYINHIRTLRSITIIPSTGKPIIIPCESPKYEQISRMLDEGRYSDVLNILDVKTALKVANSKFKFSDEKARLEIEGEVLPKALSDRLIQFVKSKIDTKPLEAFWANLRKNPTESSRNDLFAFLEANHFPITDDGCFVAYKRVHATFKDMHTNTIDNSPGRTVEMPRSAVDASRATCSTGLHVAAYEYADKHFNSGQGLLIEIKVNPRDVVAVPPDYNQQKMRVCKYKVVRVCTKGESSELIYTPKVKNVRKKASRIIKIPADQRDLVADGRNDVNIPNSLLEKIGLNLGDTVYIYVADKRSRCVIISEHSPKRCVKVIEQVVSRRSLKIRSAMFRLAKIGNQSQYQISASHGNLEVKL
jgi:hypothetical protein